jgi:hypothetical protein
MPVCMGDKCRSGTEVFRFALDPNTWISMGHMKHQRLWHEIIAVPKSVCHTVLPTPTTTDEPPTTTGEDTTTGSGTTSTTSASSRKTLSTFLALAFAFFLSVLLFAD